MAARWISHPPWQSGSSYSRGKNSDIRLPSYKAAAQQRSINLAMSSRGIAALRAIDPGASDRFLQSVIPMRGRMIHGLHGELHSQPYDRNGQVSASSQHIA